MHRHSHNKNNHTGKRKKLKSLATFFTYRHEHRMRSVKKLAGGMTNETYRVRTNSAIYVARKAGKLSDSFINRKDEKHNVGIVSALGIGPRIYYADKNGTLISQFIHPSVTMSPSHFKIHRNIRMAANTMKRLHSSDVPFSNTINIFERNRLMLEILGTRDADIPNEYLQLQKDINTLEGIISTMPFTPAPCHNDTTPSNFLVSDHQMLMIDWEYSGNNDPVWDLANLSIEASFDEAQDNVLLNTYYDGQIHDEDMRRFKLYKPIVEYWVGLWCLVQINNHNHQENPEKLLSLERKRITHCIDMLEQHEYRELLSEGRHLRSNPPRGSLRSLSI